MGPFTLHFEHYIFLLLNKLMTIEGMKVIPGIKFSKENFYLFTVL